MVLSIEQINDMVSHVVETFKPYDPIKPSGKAKLMRGEVPPYYPMYAVSVDYYNEIKVHAEKGVFPHRLFAERSPNQTPEEFDYVKSNYRQKTLPVYMDFLNVVGRAFNDGNETITWKDAENNPMLEYVNDIPVYGTLKNYMRNVVPNVKLKDANGVIAVKPQSVPRNEDGEYLNGEETKPLPYYYKSEQIVMMEDGVYFMIETNEKSKVEYAGKRQKIGKVFEIYDENTIYKVEQTGKYIDYSFEVSIYFQHNIGDVPVTRLMGVQQLIENDILYQSPFLFAVDSLDLAALNYSNLQLSINNCVYPYRVMIGNICDFEDYDGGRCDGGIVYNGEDNTQYKCTSCSGTGLRSRLSPLGTLLIKPPTADEPTSEAGIQTPMQFISPPTDSLQFLSDQADKNISNGRTILHIKDTTDQATGGDDTATGTAIEQKQMFTFVKPISDQLYMIYGRTMDAMGYMRYGDTYNNYKPTITAPITFDYLTHEDYLKMITDAVDAGLPPFVVHPLIMKYLSTLFHNDADTSTAFKLVTDTDRLLTLPSDVITGKIMSGTAAKYEEVLHNSAPQLIRGLLDKNPQFFEQSFEKQQTALIDAAKAVVMEVESTLPLPIDTDALVGAMAGSGANDNPPTPEDAAAFDAMDIEAEAKAKLKGTVGGVQGIISINKSVADGTMSEKSGELLLQELYGFDAKIAGQLIQPTKAAIKKAQQTE